MSWTASVTSKSVKIILTDSASCSFLNSSNWPITCETGLNFPDFMYAKIPPMIPPITNPIGPSKQPNNVQITPVNSPPFNDSFKKTRKSKLFKGN